MNVTCVMPAIALPGVGTGREAERRAAPPASALPCLNTNNCNEWIGFAPILSTVQRRTVYALAQNCYQLVMAHGFERVGFLTLTFARHVVSTKEAQKALHSLMTGVLKKRYPEYIVVMERMDSKRIHYHLLVVMAEDIRTGFDFDAVKRGDYRSATAYIILHELAHRRHMNHSTRYWQEVERLCPDYLAAERWIKSNRFLRD